LSLGLLLLDHLADPRGALRLFNTYLLRTSSGSLVQEASWARIRALRRLGRRGLERSALRAFLRGYPKAVQRRQAEARLRSLGAR
jgi:hypothetical protein